MTSTMDGVGFALRRLADIVVPRCGVLAKGDLAR